MGYILFFNVLQLNICIVTPVAMAINMPLIHHSLATKMAQQSNVAHTIVTETTFTRRGNALCSLKFLMYAPRCLWDMSQSYSLCELRMYIAAASNRNGVVGSTGRKTPIMPNTSDTLPKNAKRNFIVFIFRREGTKNILQRETMATAADIFLSKNSFIYFLFVHCTR